jgi:hypothetical protein
MSSSHTAPFSGVVPAQLSFLAIYNPSFGDTDETAYDQIFYFHSRLEPGETALAKDGSLLDPPPEARQTYRMGGEAAENEQLRKVGLARGMVEFAK